MLHLVLYVLLAIIVAVGLFLVASRFLPAGEQIAPAIRDEPVWELPAERSLQAEDVDTVRLPVALRGYRFAETDVLLDRLAMELRTRDQAADLVVEQLTAQLRARDAEIARLRGDPPPDPALDHVPYTPPRPAPAVKPTAAEPTAAEPRSDGDAPTADPGPDARP